MIECCRNDDGELSSVGICGAVQTVATLDADQIATLDDIDGTCISTTTTAGVEEDPCAACTEFQVLHEIACNTYVHIIREEVHLPTHHIDCLLRYVRTYL